jgi:tripartite-type tricarboxylate transporter receptor subunit TctC
MTLRYPDRRRAVGWIAALGAAATSLADAQEGWPSKPIRFVVPYPPGGSTDPIARIIAKGLTDALGQPVVIDNKPGAGTMIGTEFVARTPADGHTLLLASSSHTVNPSLYRKVNYDPIRDFTGVSLASSFPLILHVHPSLPVRNVAELVAMAKPQPGKLSFGSGGVGAANHLAGEMFNAMAGVNIVHVPYKGGSLALTDALSGQFQVMFGGIEQSLPHVRAGKLRGLAVTSARASALVPELPSVAETVAGYDVTSWNGVVVASGTRPEIVSRLNAEIVKILRTPATQESLLKLGVSTIPTTVDETNKFITAEVGRWKKVIDAAGIKLDA